MTKVAVLAGGCSPEHDVSLQSGAQVLRHLSAAHDVWPVYLDREGAWWASPEPLAPPRRAVGFKAEGMQSRSPGAALAWLLEAAGVEVVLPALHGAFGEDGAVQGMLELHAVPYVGCGVAASAVAMDKIRTREALACAGVPMPRAYVSPTPLWRADPSREADAIAQSVGFPCFLKVDVSGSSLGVQRAEGAAHVAEFLARDGGLGQRFLAEAAVEGEEITVGVLGNSGHALEALPPVGIYPVSDAFFTYDAKYTASLCEEVVPPRGLDDVMIASVQDLAVRCHQALWCDGMSRVDMIVADDGPVVLEVNTIPGMTEVSLLPRAAAAAGLDFTGLLDRLLRLALERADAGGRTQSPIPRAGATLWPHPPACTPRPSRPTPSPAPRE